ncbi:diguanylate cyclase [Duganella sp.]|uniref:diguanylate cyclase n=1 Tax=Duganella sp. TaxID=1904440 RepID=UPI0031CECB7C
MRSKAVLLIAGVLCAPAWALAASAMDKRIMELREQSRLLPDKTLTPLLALQPQVRTEPPRTQAELLAQISNVRALLDQLDTAAAIADQVVAYGKTLGDDVIVAKGLLARVAVSRARDDNKAAYRQAQEAEQLGQRSGDKPVQVAAAMGVAKSLVELGDLPAALAKLQFAVDTARQVDDDPMLLFNALRAMARLYVQIKERDKAYATLGELTALVEMQRLPIQMVLLKLSEFVVASNFGEADRALRAQLDGLALQRKLGASRMLGGTLNNLADSYLRRHDYPRAAQYASEALLATKGLNETGSDAVAHMNLGQAYLGMGRIAEGKLNIEAGLKWFEQTGGKPDLQSALLEYGQALEAAGDMAGAVSAYHRERAISNELFETRRQQAMLELQERYDADKSQQQIRLLQSENENQRWQKRVWLLLVLVFALASAVVGLLYRKIRQVNGRLASKNLELAMLSTLDPLTGLYNRRHFQDYMASLKPPADATIGALFLLDVDHFKHINDSYGHAAGDAVLKMIASQLRIVLRETDVIVRWGGEEFLAFLPALPHQRIEEVARRVLQGVAAQQVRYQEHDIAVRVSVGFAPFPLAPAGAPLSWERVVNLADMALYLAKTNGRNRAYGIRGFANLQHTSIEAVEQDLERAWRAGYVEMQVVAGEAADSSRPRQCRG